MPTTAQKATKHATHVQTLQVMLDEANEGAKGSTAAHARHAHRADALRHALNCIESAKQCVDGEHEHSRSWLCHPSQELLVLADTLGVHLPPRF